MKRVMITGSKGFLGRNLIKTIYKRELNKEWELILPSRNTCNLENPLDVNSYFSIFKPEIVINLAAHAGGIGLNMAKPAELYYENLMIGTNVIHYSYIHSVKKVVSILTTCMYPKFTQVPFEEDDIWNGYPEETNSYYAIAKRAIMTQGQAYRKQYGMNIINLIPANLYGPFDHFDLEYGHVIPTLIMKFINAKNNNEPSVTLWGTGKPTREFLYVEDCANAILDATIYYNEGDPVNIGTGESHSIKEVAETIKEITKYDGNIIWDSSKPDGQPKRCLDTSKAVENFGWRANVSLKKGLSKTINWYLENGC